MSGKQDESFSTKLMKQLEYDGDADGLEPYKKWAYGFWESDDRLTDSNK